jgi:SNF2 family DNA or RNA helicase
MKVSVCDENIVITCAYELKDYIKGIPTAKWDAKSKSWVLKNRQDVISVLMDTLRRLDSKFTVDIDDDAKKLIASHGDALLGLMEQIKRADMIRSGTLGTGSTIPFPLIKTKPFEHQIVAIDLAMTLDASAMFMEMGTGKTLVAIACIGYRYRRKEINRVLIVAPLSVTSVWKDEFKKHADFEYTLSMATGPNVAAKMLCFDPSIPVEGVDVVVINYDSTVERRPWPRRISILDAILAWKPDMVICDESQRIKNKDSKRSEALHKIGDSVKYKMILSGTPVTNSPLDVWSQYRFLNPLIFGDSFYAFRGKYATMHKQTAYSTGRTFTVIDGYKHLDDLTNKAHSIAYRVTKEEALDLPEFVDETLYCNLSAPTREHYKTMEKEARLAIEAAEADGDKALALWHADAPSILVKLLRLAQITGGFLPMKGDDTGTKTIKISHEKMDVLRDFMEDYPKGKKLVIFARFLSEIDAIKEMLEKMGITVATLMGATTDRGLVVDNFQNGTDPQVLVAQIATGGIGITLTAADTVVFYSVGYSYEDYQQARARVHRIGQKNNVTYVNIVARRTVDEGIIEALQEKKNVADVVVDRIKARI